MLLDVGTFCTYVENDLNGLIDALGEITNLKSSYQIDAWRKSLPKLSLALQNPQLSNFHIQVGQSGYMAVEYNLPASSSWCDAVLLGRNEKKPVAVMLELKDWDIRDDAPSNRETLVIHHGMFHSHPSDQVRGYVEYCRHFHSSVVHNQADILGCTFFTGKGDPKIYREAPYTTLVNQYPVFTVNEVPSLSTFLSEHLHSPDEEFARSFEKGQYIQDRNLVRQLSDMILNEDQQVFVLLDEQRKGYELCLQEIDNLLSTSITDEKLVIIIEGPPGSGKSVLAAKLWAALAHETRWRGNVVMTSTSSSQKSNWQASFEKAIKSRPGRGLVLPANKYNPGLNQTWLRDYREEGGAPTAKTWRENISHFNKSGRNNQMPDNQMWVSIVDEAHALVDPTLDNLEGVASSGWAVMAGPQAYHIIRASQISIFLMDSDQSYRDNETTTPSRIEQLAIEELELSPTSIKSISLGDAQFRCGGSKEYITWLDQILGLTNQPPTDLSWRKNRDGSGRFEFEVASDPLALEQSLRKHHQENHSVRLMATYARKWKTKKSTSPHSLPPEEMDFHIPYIRDDKTEYWSRIWNYAPDSNYYYFIQAPSNTPMYSDPLCEVGCPYVVRGFDYDYLGVLWLQDLVWRNDHWEANPEEVFETAWNLTLARAKAEKRRGENGPYSKSLCRQLQRGYRILLSRALKGIYIWFEDEETRDHIQSFLK